MEQKHDRRPFSSSESDLNIQCAWDGGEGVFFGVARSEIPPFFMEHLHRCPELIQGAYACRAAGDILRSRYGSLNQQASKSDGSIVTEVDNQSQSVMSALFSRFEPSGFIVGEEDAEGVLGEVPAIGKGWVIDPLDATEAYANSLGEEYPSVMAARVENGIVVASIVHFPLRDEWFYALLGGGAFKDGERLSVDKYQELNLKEAVVDINRYSEAKRDEFGSERIKRFEQRSQQGDVCKELRHSVAHSGIALRMLEGKGADLIIHDNNPDLIKQARWDTDPIQLIVEEAGGVFLGMFGMGRYNPKRPEPIMVARSRELCEEAAAVFNR